ncbi:hypothetical protein C8Q75DRAFT_800735 [Abortiporus biennis]|nr:hypothetical protein C8Q75DRAFT_800735 [Abortiporus biennis]
MAPARYAPLPNPRSLPTDAERERELDEAFESDQDDDDLHDHSESTPLVPQRPPSPAAGSLQTTALAVTTTPAPYDFERDYDHPPPGSPPGPSATARPNDYGNSNGLLPEVVPERPEVTRPSFFRRTVGALLPQYYSRLPTESEASNSRTVGGGIENDGVFANVMAKPSRATQVRTQDGEAFLVPEESQKDAPPTYAEAQADAVPQYWETTVHAPANLDPNADMIVDDLPTGGLAFFVANTFISYFFGFIGFLLTYLLHTSHAAKYGSRAGLGLTLIQYGFASRNNDNTDDTTGADSGLYYWNETTGFPEPIPTSSPLDPMTGRPMVNHGMGMMQSANPTPTNGTIGEVTLPDGYAITSRDWLAFLLMTLGWFLLLSSIVGFYRVKRWEMSIRASNSQANAAAAQPPSSDRQREIEREFRQNIERVFFVRFGDNNENEERRVENGEEEHVANSHEMNEAEARLARDLRAAGLI